MKFSFEELEELTQKDGGRFGVDSSDSAFDFCRILSQKHYENFPVASFLLKKEWRKYIFAVYSFARIADDIADEIIEIPEQNRINLLDNLEELIQTEDFTKIKNPVIKALIITISDKKIPIDPFKKLLTAYKMDINFKQAETFYELLDYCKYSAEPIGELVLRITDNYNNKNIILSDKICSALQLINFWQDFSVDLNKNRVFIPMEYLAKYDLKMNDLYERKKTHNLISCLKELYDRTEILLKEGAELIKYLEDFRLKLEIKATVMGGAAVLNKIRELQANILEKRPKLSKTDFLLIFYKIVFSR